jgi:hypothetical protein
MTGRGVKKGRVRQFCLHPCLIKWLVWERERGVDGSVDGSGAVSQPGAMRQLSQRESSRLS